MLFVEPLTSSWLIIHNYSIRKKPPFIPLLGGSYTPIITTPVIIPIQVFNTIEQLENGLLVNKSNY